MTPSSEPGRSPASGPAPRISQRAPTSCTFCYRRKIKCNKQFPCENCIKRDVADTCVRESVLVRGAVVGGGESDERQPLTNDQVRVLSEAQLRAEVAQLRKKLNQQDKIIAGLQEQRAQSEEVGSVASSSRRTLDPPAPVPIQSPVVAPSVVKADKEDILRPYLRVLGLPVEQTRSPINRPSAALDEPLGPPAWKMRRADNGLQFQSLLELVPIEQSVFLVETSLNMLDWIHCVVHVPTYVKEHKEWIERLRRGDKEVKEEQLASGLYFLDDSLALALGLSKADVVTLPHLWFEASLEALHRSDFMSTPTFEAVQLICILPMASPSSFFTYILASAYIESLLHMGLKIAQSLNLHLLGPETPNTPTAGVIRRELGRRIWTCLFIAESHRDFTIPGGLYLPPSAAVEPANINDENLSDAHPMLPRRPHEPTLVSHLVAMGRHARIFRQFGQTFHQASSSLEQQYEVVIRADQQLLRLLDDFPSLKPNSDPYPVSHDIRARFDYLPMSRFMWAMNIGPSRIQLSASKPRAASCTSVGAPFLHFTNVHVHPRRHITAYSVLAGVILATELIHGSGSPGANSQLHADVSEIIAILPRGGPSNKVVTRGVDLLSRVLRDFENAVTPPPDVEQLWPGVEEWASWGEMEGGAQGGVGGGGGDLWTNTVRTFESQQDPFWVSGERWWNG
ncbi:hypothetical protein RQP46_009370 [Phenoliferia psychrophenolica]